MTYENENPYSTYDSSGVTPQDLLARLTALQSRLNATMSYVERTEEGLLEKQSKITQDIDTISLNVSSLQTLTDGHTASISDITLTTDEIELSVAAIDSRLGAAESSISVQAGQIESKVSVTFFESEIASTKTYADGAAAHAEENATLHADGIAETLENRIVSAESSITQNANQIALKVSQTDYTGATIMSLIEQTPAEITLAASRIELYGLTHVNDTLYIGDPSHTSTKTIWFNSAGNISATGFGYLGLPELKFNMSNLNFEDISYMWFNQTYPTEVYGKVDFANATVTGLNVTVSFG